MPTINIPVTIPDAPASVATEKLDRIEKMLSFLLVNPDKKIVTIDDIAVWEGVSISQLRKGGKQRYLLPRFGQSAYPDGRTRWPIDEYLAWSARPASERKAEYMEHLRNRTQRALSRM